MKLQALFHATPGAIARQRRGSKFVVLVFAHKSLFLKLYVSGRRMMTSKRGGSGPLQKEGWCKATRICSLAASDVRLFTILTLHGTRVCVPMLILTSTQRSNG